MSEQQIPPDWVDVMITFPSISLGQVEDLIGYDGGPTWVAAIFDPLDDSWVYEEVPGFVHDESGIVVVDCGVSYTERYSYLDDDSERAERIVDLRRRYIAWQTQLAHRRTQEIWDKCGLDPDQYVQGRWVPVIETMTVDDDEPTRDSSLMGWIT